MTMIGRNLVVWLGCCMIATYAQLTLREMHSWRYIEYWYDSFEEKYEAFQKGLYYFKRNCPVDVEVSPDGKVFVTILRKKGVPVSLTTVKNKLSYGGGRYLTAYPDWSWSNLSDCDSIISAHRIAQDECDRLWVLDSGKVDDKYVCPPKLLAFDMTTDALADRVVISDEFATNSNGDGFLVNLAIDTMGEDCAKTRVYMADTNGNGLVIYDGKKLWRIESPKFEADPGHEEFSVDGTNFNLTKGLFALSITRDEPDPVERLLYFRPLSSLDMFHTKTAELELDKDEESSIEYFKESTQLKSQSTTQAFSSEGILFFSDTTAMSILCWNRNKPFTQENIVTVAQDESALQWASGVKIRQGLKGEELWILTNRWQDFQTDTMNFTQKNFRILTAMVEDLVNGTNCKIS